MRNPYRDHWSLDPDVVFLNHGSFGACPDSVIDAQAEWRRQIDREPMRFYTEVYAEALDRAREQIAQFLGAEASGLVFVRNATSGVNAALYSYPFEAGDEILVCNHGYDACVNAAERVAALRGAVVRRWVVPFPGTTEDAVLESLNDALTSRTRVVLVDHVTSPTGLVFPLARILEKLRERSIDAIVDGAHAPGMLDLNLDALQPAYYAGNFHKWCCAPKGSAFLWVRSDLRATTRHPIASHADSLEPGERRFRFSFDWVGTDDPSGWLTVPAAIDFVASLMPGGWSAIRAHSREMALTARKMLNKVLEVDPVCPDSMIGSLASVALPGTHEISDASHFYQDPLQRALIEKHRIRVPVIPWLETRQRFVRISSMLYNLPDEYEVLGRALRTELGQG